jgi:hypothetical protein
LLARADALLEQKRVALFVGRGLPVLRAILGEIRFGLMECGFEWTGIDREQQVALLDVLSLAKVHPHYLTADLRLHINGGERLDAADRMNRVGDRLLLDLGCQNWHRVALAEGVRGPVRASCHRNQCERRDQSCRVPLLQGENAFGFFNWATALPDQSYGPRQQCRGYYQARANRENVE